MKAIVVGAGYAGLSCARALAQGGASVVVLEARERVGGRVWSTTMSDGVVVERGGEFLFPGYALLPELVHELGLELVEHGFVYADRRPVGGGLAAREVVAAAAARMAEHRAERARAHQRGSIEDVIAGAELEPGERAMLRARLTISLGWRLDEVSEAWPAPQISADGHSEFTMTSRILGGNQRLAEAIAAELAGEVRLRTAAVAVEQDAGGVAVKVAGGDVERADAVVIATPAPIVRRLRFDPALPPASADAYGRVGMAVVSKLQVTLGERVAPEAIQTSDAPFWAYTAVEPDGRCGVVASAAGGATAQERLAVDAGPRRWLVHLARAWPELRLGGEAMVTAWGLEPWSRGAYSYRPLDWSDEAEASLSAPVGRIAFAGEHTAAEQTTDGALESGRRAAQEILELAA